jgi:integrase
VRGTKTEVNPVVWRLRVYAGRRANGTPIQITKMVRARDKNPRPGAGSRLADSELAKMVAKVAQGDTATGTKTVGELLNEWLAHCETLGRSPTTMREYNRLTEKTVRPEIGHLRLSKLTSRDLDRLYAKLTAKGNKATTVRRVDALIAAALHQAERWGDVDRNVSRRASPPPVHAAQVDAPAPEEVQAILAAAEAVEPTLAVLLLLGALTEARRGELCALRWPDIDFDAGTLSIARSIYEVAGGGWAEKGTKLIRPEP